MSAFSLLNKPVSEIATELTKYKAELRPTKFDDTYLIKFSPETKMDDPAVNQLRGVIFSHEQLYSLGYPVPTEFKDQTEDVQQKILASIHSREYVVHEALDGTLIRLWYHNPTGKWVISTNGVEDAYDSYWMNNVSFGQLFDSTLQGIFTNLNQDQVYLFALCHPMNVIVVNHEAPKIYHVATYDRNTLKEIVVELGIEHPPVMQMSVDDVLCQTRQSHGTPVMSAGYMVVQSPDADGVVHRHRFENVNYTQARVLRGNSNDINYVLMGHMLDPDSSKIMEFLQYYPIYVPTYNWLITRLMELIRQLFQEYGLRYKQRRDIFVHPRHHRFLEEIHRLLYLCHLKPQGLTVQHPDILNFVYNLPVARVIYLLNLADE